jgi:hypothetical protein
VTFRYQKAEVEIKNVQAYRSRLVNMTEGHSYASTFHSNPPNYRTELYPRFWQRDEVTPPSSMAGILVHELIHAVDRFTGDPGPVAYYPEQNEFAIGRAWFSDPKNILGRFAKGDKMHDGDAYKWFAEKQK